MTSAAKASRSTASAEPAGTRCLSAARMIERAERAHLLVEQADGIVLGIVGAEAVRADHLGEAVGLVRRSRVAAAAHFAQAHAQARLGELPGGFGTGEAAADDVDVEGHAGLLVPLDRAIQRTCASSPSATKARRCRSSWRRYRTRASSG